MPSRSTVPPCEERTVMTMGGHSVKSKRIALVHHEFTGSVMRHAPVASNSCASSS